MRGRRLIVVAPLVIVAPATGEVVTDCWEEYGWFERLSVDIVLDDGATVPATTETDLWPPAFPTEPGLFWSGDCPDEDVEMPIAGGGSLVFGCAR